jgi:hypothetical protein
LIGWCGAATTRAAGEGCPEGLRLQSFNLIPLCRFATVPGADALAPPNPGGLNMNLPKIDLSSLPDLDKLTGVFGSLIDYAKVQSDDSLIIVMAFIYNLK